MVRCPTLSGVQARELQSSLCLVAQIVLELNFPNMILTHPCLPTVPILHNKFIGCHSFCSQDKPLLCLGCLGGDRKVVLIGCVSTQVFLHLHDGVQSYRQNGVTYGPVRSEKINLLHNTERLRAEQSLISITSFNFNLYFFIVKRVAVSYGYWQFGVLFKAAT